jgi:LytS/YehU family sensor histidine kinase
MNLYVEDDRLEFKLINSMDQEKKQANYGGLGLTNVRKRLDYLYPGGHTLMISEDEDVFVVSLQLPLFIEKEHITIASSSSLNQTPNEVKMFAGG